MPTDYRKLKQPLKGRGTSHSALKTFDQPCKLPVYFTKVLRMQPDFGFASERGNKIHLEGEHFLKGDIPKPTKAFELFESEMLSLKKLKAVPELSIAVNKNWEETDYDQYNRTGRVLFRAKFDACVVTSVKKTKTLNIIDYKTGGIYEDHEQQAETYAAIAVAHFPEVDLICVEFWYLDFQEGARKFADHDTALGESPFLFTRKDAIKAAQSLRKRALKFDGAKMSDLKEAKVNIQNCGFCKFRSDVKLADGSDGPCEKYRLLYEDEE